MPETRARRRGDAADHLDRAPHRRARRLDTRTRRRLIRAGAELGDAQMRGIAAAQRGVGRLARLAAEATADSAGQCLLLGQGAALGTAARRQMTERMVLGAKARSRPAWRPARERRAIGSKREGAAAILSIVRS